MTEPHKTPAPLPVETRNEEVGFVEFINSDVPHIVRDIEGRVAILVDMETRNVIGYRVYDRPSIEAETVKAVEDLRSYLLSRISVFRDMEPEEDEDWKSWYFAAFDLLRLEIAAIHDRKAEPLFASPQPGVVEALREVLKFYANEKNWMAGRWPEDPDELVEGLICIDWQHEEGGSIAVADCGDRARKALAATGGSR